MSPSHTTQQQFTKLPCEAMSTNAGIGRHKEPSEEEIKINLSHRMGEGSAHVSKQGHRWQAQAWLQRSNASK